MNYWILVLVKRGCIEEPLVFSSYGEANIKKIELLRDFNRDYDEIQIFRKQFDF